MKIQNNITKKRNGDVNVLKEITKKNTLSKIHN